MVEEHSCESLMRERRKRSRSEPLEYSVRYEYCVLKGRWGKNAGMVYRIKSSHPSEKVHVLILEIGECYLTWNVTIEVEVRVDEKSSTCF